MFLEAQTKGRICPLKILYKKLTTNKNSISALLTNTATPEVSPLL